MRFGKSLTGATGRGRQVSLEQHAWCFHVFSIPTALGDCKTLQLSSPFLAPREARAAGLGGERSHGESLLVCRSVGCEQEYR